ncbi:MAG: 3'-5' exonuclease [Pseudomonadota bacterium]
MKRDVDETRFVVVDVETTGLSSRRGDRIIEVGAVIVKGREIAAEFCSLIRTDKPIPFAAEQIHGITNEMLIGKPKPEEVFPQFREFIGNSALVAHNAQFDIGFLRHEFSRLGLGLNNRYFCTLEMSRARYPNLSDHKLGTVFRHLFGRPGDQVRGHRALGDARMVAWVWLELMRK